MNRKALFPIAALAAVLTLSGCSLFEKKVKKEAVLPQDREQIHTSAPSSTYSPEELTKGIVKGDWAIETVNGKPAVGETAPFLRFVTSEKKVYGNNGCNTINYSYKYNPADSTISFSDGISTMMACGKQGITDYEVMTALNSARRYTWQLDNSDYILHLLDANNVELMTLMHRNFDFLNGTWRVTAIEGEPINVPEMKLVIDVDEQKLHGNTGCNIINGRMEIDMETANSISFSGIQLTRMACPNPEFQTRLIVALEDASTARPVSIGKVEFLNSSGKTVLTLVRSSDK